MTTYRALTKDVYHVANAVTDQTFDDEVINAKGVSLVDFWAPWCGPCRIIGPIVDELAAEYEGKANIVKLNVDENPQTAGRFGIQGIPTLLLFKDGELIDTLVGVQPKETLVAKIDAAL